MFTPKGLFSEITCPYNESCALPNCLFAHSKAVPPKDKPTWASKSPERPLSEVEINHDGQRKRRKIDVQAEAIHSSETTPLNPISKPLASLLSIGDRKEIVPSNNVPVSLKTDSKTKSSQLLRNRPISPPPLRRHGESPSKLAVTPNPTPRKIPVDPKPKPPLVAVKTEGLNPRLLKHSPASHDIRYRLLKALHEQFSRLNSELSKDVSDSEKVLVLSTQELITMALDFEENTAIEKSAIYSNIVKNNILRYKRMTIKDWKIEREKDRAQRNASKVEVVTPSAVPESPKPVETGLTEGEELELLPKLYTPLTGLSKHGYVVSIPTENEINTAKKGIEAAKGWEVCDRCKTRFQVFPGRREEDGALASGGTCTYHWGKPFYQEKSASDPKSKRERKYRCCGELLGDSTGCTKAETHVFKVSEVKRLAAILNFAETPPNDTPSKTPVCIDGEMGYTVHGLELVRLTATSWPNGDELLDILVRPIGEVLDLNSRWSGVWPQQMADAVPWAASIKPEKGKLLIASSPAMARDLLFKHLSPTTPLIGHGLENDLNSVRIIHPTVIDTCLLFPHKAGLPYRNGLKSLMLQHLNRNIQVQIVTDGKMEGHDSKEDANAAGDLVRWKIGEMWTKMKIEGWKIEEGRFVAPTAELYSGQGLLSVEFLERGEGSDGSPMNETRWTGRAKRPISEISGDNPK